MIKTLKSFNKRFESTQGSYVSSFFSDEYLNYAVYKVLQRLPNAADSLAQTQRKLVCVLEQRPPARKIKTAETYGMIYNEMKYLHGDASAFNASESLSRGSSNCVNIFTEEGNFGFRTNRDAAGPRYTNTRFSQAARLIFRSEDKNILTPQEFEGKEIEPLNLLPIVPPMLINGQEAIAVGYASKTLPRDPLAVIDTLIVMLKQHKTKKTEFKNMRPGIIPVAYPFFNGSAIRDMDRPTESAWVMRGVLTKSKRRNFIDITEVPPSFTREGYLKKLKKLIEKGVVKSFTEACKKNGFIFRVKLDGIHWSKTPDELTKLLGLEETVVENFTFIDPLGEDSILKFTTAETYLKHFVELRQEGYQARKLYLISSIKEELNMLANKIRFIQEVNAGDILVTKRKKIDLEKELSEKDFLKIEDSFDYLLGIRLWNLTDEMVKKLQEKIQLRNNDLKVITETATEDTHIAELRELRKFIQPELKRKGLV